MQCFKHRRNAPYLHPPDSSNLPILPIQGWLPWLQVGPIAFRDFYLIEFWPSTLSPHTSSSRRRCASFMLRLLLAALWDAQTFCLGLGQLLEITIAHNKSCGCAFGFRFFCRAVVMHDWNTHTHIYMLRFSAVWLACLLFPYHITTGSPSPHCLGSLAGVFFYTKDIVEMFLHALGWCRMLEAPMHVGSCFSCFSFQIFALPGAPRDFEGTSPPFRKIFRHWIYSFQQAAWHKLLDTIIAKTKFCEIRMVTKWATKN